MEDINAIEFRNQNGKGDGSYEVGEYKGKNILRNHADVSRGQ
jgi:hypothetical protein